MKHATSQHGYTSGSLPHRCLRSALECYASTYIDQAYADIGSPVAEFVASQLGDAAEALVDAVECYVRPYWDEYIKPHWDVHVQPHIDASLVPLWANLISYASGKLVWPFMIRRVMIPAKRKFRRRLLSRAIL